MVSICADGDDAIDASKFIMLSRFFYCQGKPYGKSADVFSFGVLVWEMLHCKFAVRQDGLTP